MTDFAVGQRWLSENEPELGLGIIQSIDYRLITIFFPSIEGERTYAKNNAPLSRYIFEPGETIETLKGDFLRVQQIEHLNGIIIYMALESKSREVLPVPETQLSHVLDLSKASDRLFSGQTDSIRWFELRYQALQAKSTQELSPVLGLQGPRVDLLPHQLYIAHEVGNRFAPRVLLADEVGLGKTIEAGMIIHQQVINQRAQRVLIVVPDPLVNQWFVEMVRRFNLHFSIFDQSRVDALNDLGDLALGDDICLDDLELENPFVSEQFILCGSDFFARCDLEQVSSAGWDLLVVDEAHHLEWHPDSPSPLYQKVEQLSRQIPGLLLLSATPEQLGQESHFARLRLLDPKRFHSLAAFQQEQKSYRPIAELIESLDQQTSWSESVKAELAHSIDDIELIETNREVIIGELLDRNGTSRVLYRNTRKNIKGFPLRQLHPHPLKNTERYANEIEDTLNESIGFLLHPETQYIDDSWLSFDPRVDWLKQFLLANLEQKILVICAKKETAIALELHCRFKFGINSASFHEDLDIISRDRAAAFFADQSEGAQVLFCSEIGSEGRNFQFAHHLVLLDLPANPDLLEQRIGRLDRIGQSQNIHIHVPFMLDSAQQAIFHWYHQGMNAFAKVNPAGSAVLKATQALLFDALLAPDNHELQNQLIEETAQTTQRVNQLLESGRDRLLERASFNQAQAERLVNQLQARDALSPQSFMETCWDAFGVNLEEHSEHAYIISPGDHMFVGAFPGLAENGLTVTYQRAKALSRDDMQFLTWEHPMVKGAIDLVLAEDKGNACVCILKNKAIKPGTLLMEAVYSIDCIAPGYLQPQRYLPFTTLRVLCDVSGNDLADKVSHENLSKQCAPLTKEGSRQLVKSEAKTIKKMLAAADNQARLKASTQIDTALTKMRQEQNSELNRLVALQKKNPNIRPEELAFLQKQTQLLENYLQDTQVQLDSLKVIVAI